MSDHINTASEEIARSLQHLEGPLLPVLHSIQDRFGHIPSESVAVVAGVLNLSRAEVHGVISFYHDFRQQPGGRQVVSICRAEACQAVGGAALAEHARHSLGIDFEETSTDRAVSLRSVYCLGLCACGPALRIDDQLHGRVSCATFDALMSE